MRDSWLNHNTDKLLLYSLVLLTGFMILHMIHHDHIDQQALAWGENAFSTVLGALILILTGRVQRADTTPPPVPPSPDTPKQP